MRKNKHIIVLILLISIVSFAGCSFVSKDTETIISELKESANGVLMEVGITRNKSEVQTMTMDRNKYDKINEEVRAAINNELTPEKVPTVQLTDKQELKFTFFKDGKGIKPDYTPKITLAVGPSDKRQIEEPMEEYNEKFKINKETGVRTVVEELILDEDKYMYRPRLYQPQYKTVSEELARCKINYYIDGQEHVSLFVIKITNGDVTLDSLDLVAPILPDK